VERQSWRNEDPRAPALEDGKAAESHHVLEAAKVPSHPVPVEEKLLIARVAMCRQDPALRVAVPGVVALPMQRVVAVAVAVRFCWPWWWPPGH